MSLAFEQSSPGESQMRLREHSAVQSKSDMFSIDPRKLKVDPNYNVRSMESKETRDHIAALKASILANGVKVPLEVRIEGEKIFIVAGHCRHIAVLEAIKEGAEIRSVPCIPEAKGTSEADRTINLIVSNSGKGLAPLEVAKVVKRLADWGWSHKDIADRAGWKSVNTVKQHLEMVALPEDVKQQVHAGDVSATLARKIAKGVDPEKAAELIRANKEENARIRGKDKRTKVTPKTIKRDAPKPPPAEAKAESAPEPAAGVETVSVVLTGLGLVDGNPAAIVELAGGGGATPPNASGGFTPPEPMPAQAAEQPETSIREIELAPGHRVEFTRPRGINELFEAIAPIAAAVALTDLNEVADDDTVVIQISGKDAKRFSLIYTKATGDDVRDQAA